MVTVFTVTTSHGPCSGLSRYDFPKVCGTSKSCGDLRGLSRAFPVAGPAWIDGVRSTVPSVQPCLSDAVSTTVFIAVFTAVSTAVSMRTWSTG